jgi:polyisoprenoid-binding protein YceI
MLRTWFATAVAAIALVAQAAHAVPLTVLYDKSRITCVSRQEKVPVEAQFKTFTAQIAFDPARPEAGKVQIDIDVASFDIGFAEYNDDAKGPNWFDARKFPQARFVSTSLRALGSGRFEARGPLTIKGRTAEAVAPFTYRVDGGTGVFEGSFPIRRLQYNIGDGVWRDTDTIADEVLIKFRIVASAAPAAAVKR